MNPRGVGRTIAAQCLLLCLASLAWTHPSCPPRGWTCQQELGDEWTATSTLPGLEPMTVAYEESNQNEAIVTISCSANIGSSLPASLLANFTGTESVTYFRIRSCRLATNSTVAAVLTGQVVTKLRYLPARPLGDDLDPAIFAGLDQLSYLSVEGGGLTSLRDGQFASCPALTRLSLKMNKLSRVATGAFTGLPNLTHLDLSNNNLTELDGRWAGLTNIQMLMLFHNHIENISREFIASAPNLSSIDLQDNRIAELAPDTFHDAPHLLTLNLFKNELRAVPEQLLAFQTRLEQLNLSDNRRLATLPPGLIRNVTSLTMVNLERCGIVTVPVDFFRSLPNLITLQLNHNDIADLEPETFADLKNLVTLDLSHNILTTLRKGVLHGLTNLNKLKLSNNRLTYIEPGAFYQQIALSSLNLSTNELSSNNISGRLFVKTALKILNLSRNNLTHVRSSQPLFQLPNTIEDLKLSRNSFTALPSEWLTESTRLINLDLSFNQLTSFVSNDCQPTSDQLVLNLRSNQIATADIDLHVEDSVAEDNGPIKTSRAIVQLGDNPFNCDCNSDSLLRYFTKQLNHSYLYVIDLDGLVCKQPAAVAQRPLTTLTRNDLVCYEVINCPPRCRCRKFTRGETTVDCAGSDMSALPTKAPFQANVLHMENNSVTDLSGLLSKDWAELHELYLDGNGIESIANITQLPVGLQLLGLANNSLRTLSRAELDLIDRYPQLAVNLRGNPWHCDCSAQDLKRWLSENVARVVGTVSSVLCYDEGLSASSDRPLYRENVCPSANPRGVLVGVTVAGLVLAAGVAAAAIGYYRFRHEIKVWLYARGWCLWFVTEQEVDRDKTYDAFISFSQEDSEFVASYLLPGLEHGSSSDPGGGGGGADPPKYRVCIHYRDWLAGEWIPDQIVRSVQESRRTIVVLSKNFIRSVWGRLEFKAAHHQALQDRTNRVVVVVLGDLPPASEMDPELKLYVKFNTYLKWGDPWFWQKLRYAMPHRPLSSGPAHLPRPPPRQPKNTSKVPPTFLTSTTTNTVQTPHNHITEPTRIPMTSVANGNVISDKITGDKLELVRV